MNLKPASITGAILIASMASLIQVSAHAAPPQENEQRHVAWNQAFAQSRILFQAGQYDQAETLLFDLNRNNPAAAAWHLESAMALMRVGLSLRQIGQAELATVIGQRALAQLGQAEQKLKMPTDTLLAANIKELAGTISEQLAGTTELAKAYYRAAVQLNPNAATAASALAKLDKADQNTAARQPGKPGGD